MDEEQIIMLIMALCIMICGLIISYLDTKYKKLLKKFKALQRENYYLKYKKD